MFVFPQRGFHAHHSHDFQFMGGLGRFFTPGGRPRFFLVSTLSFRSASWRILIAAFQPFSRARSSSLSIMFLFPSRVFHAQGSHQFVPMGGWPFVVSGANPSTSSRSSSIVARSC